MVLGVDSAVVNLDNNGGTLSAVTIGGQLFADLTFATTGSVVMSASATNPDRTFWNSVGGANPATDTTALGGATITTGLLNSTATFLFGQTIALDDRLVFFDIESGGLSEAVQFFPVDAAGTPIGNYSLSLTANGSGKSTQYGPNLIAGGFTLAAEDLATPIAGFNARGVSFSLADMTGDFGDLALTQGFLVDDPFGALDVDPALAAIANVLPPNADFNNDSQVNALDLEILAANYQSNVFSQASGDANGDGRVDYVDYLEWRRVALNDPASLASLLGDQSVPEPTSLSIVAIGLALLGGGLATKRR
jgi:hypothetical protein